MISLINKYPNASKSDHPQYHHQHHGCRWSMVLHFTFTQRQHQLHKHIIMIATIATVCSAASTTATNPAASSHEGRRLNGYTQGPDQPCDFVSYCKEDLKCAAAVFGTGKCVYMIGTA